MGLNPYCFGNAPSVECILKSPDRVPDTVVTVMVNTLSRCWICQERHRILLHRTFDHSDTEKLSVFYDVRAHLTAVDLTFYVSAAISRHNDFPADRTHLLLFEEFRTKKHPVRINGLPIAHVISNEMQPKPIKKVFPMSLEKMQIVFCNLEFAPSLIKLALLQQAECIDVTILDDQCRPKTPKVFGLFIVIACDCDALVLQEGRVNVIACQCLGSACNGAK